MLGSVRWDGRPPASPNGTVSGQHHLDGHSDKTDQLASIHLRLRCPEPHSSLNWWLAARPVVVNPVAANGLESR